MAAEFKDLEIYQWTSPVRIGDTFRCDCWFDHRGDAFNGLLYAAIGVRGMFFNEFVGGSTPLNLSAKPGYWQTEYKAVFIDVTSPLVAGVYDLYAKIVQGIFSPYYDDVVVVEGETLGPATFSGLFADFSKV